MEKDQQRIPHTDFACMMVDTKSIDDNMCSHDYSDLTNM